MLWLRHAAKAFGAVQAVADASLELYRVRRLLLEEAAATGPHSHRQVIFQPELVIRESSVPHSRQEATATPR